MIKQTLYRTAHPSVVTSALERAVENGKQVTVLVELKARFDEETNVRWAERLRRAGALVLYGIAGLKVHSKACLIVRREADGIRRYLHLGTGNYNEKTAQTYSDLGYFTTDEKLTSDAVLFFNCITGYSNPTGFSKFEMSPYGLKRALLRLIQREALHSSREKPGLIMAKMNSLVDPDIIEALYHASQAGAEIRLNVRGICCLRPGVKGLSETITVRSIVDMFLEHSRIFYFQNNGDEEVYLSSADWMPRNLERRIELMFPIESKRHKKELIELLRLYFKDNVRAWRLLETGIYEKIAPAAGEKRFRVQEVLCRRAAEKQTAEKTAPKELKPQKPKD
jgi:polyphosphate kinase